MKNKIKVILPFAVCLLIQLAVAVCGSVVSGIMYPMAHPEALSMSPEELGAGVQEFYLGILPQVLLVTHLVNSLIMYFWFKKVLVKDPDTKAKVNLNAMAIVFIVIMGVAIQFSTTGIMELISFVNADIFENYSKLMEQTGLSTDNVFSIISAVILAPIGEELVFRGLTMKYLKRAGASIIVANIIQAVLFGLMHLNPVQSTYAAVMGLFMGYVYLKYNNILASILLHLVVNSLSFILGLFLSNMYTVPAMACMAIVGVVLLVVITLQIKKTAPEIKWELPVETPVADEEAFEE